MKSKTSIGAIIFYALTLMFYSCQTVAEDTTPSEMCQLEIRTKVSGQIPTENLQKEEICLYVYDSAKKQRSTHSGSMEGGLKFNLPHGDYTLVAVTSIPSDYLGKKMKFEDVIKLNDKNVMSVPMLYGRTSINVRKKSCKAVVNLQSAMARVKVKISGIREAESVKLKLADISCGLRMDGNISEEGKISTIECVKDGFDYVADSYILPCIHKSVPLSLEVQHSNEIKTYGYTIPISIKANTPYEINASYTDGSGIESDFIINEWNKPVVISIDFGPDGTDGKVNDGDEDKNNDDESSDSQIPKVGTIWKDGLVSAISTNKKYVLLMSVDGWYGSISEFNPAPTYSAGGHKWQIPTDEQAKGMAKQVLNVGIDKINTVLNSIGGESVDSDERFLCLKKDEFYTFKFSKTQRITKAGDKKEYLLRLVSIVKITE